MGKTLHFRARLHNWCKLSTFKSTRRKHTTSSCWRTFIRLWVRKMSTNTSRVSSFSFVLPDSCDSSYRKGYGKIKYECKVEIERAFPSRNIKYVKVIYFGWNFDQMMNHFRNSLSIVQLICLKNGVSLHPLLKLSKVIFFHLRKDRLQWM